VIAAGGIGDGRGIAAAFALGAAGAQIGTAYLGCPEATISPLHRQALAEPGRATAIADVFSGRPARAVLNRFAREQGPIDPAHPAFPLATPALAPLRSAAEARGSGDFSWFWSGQGGVPEFSVGAAALTRKFADQALACLPK
jgi:nitronate monooxygenase